VDNLLTAEAQRTQRLRRDRLLILRSCIILCPTGDSDDCDENTLLPQS
jgi:hypothetical protein